MKAWYKSKMLWVNLVGIAAIIAQSQFGFVISADKQVVILGVLNFILRFITSDPVGMTDGE